VETLPAFDFVFTSPHELNGLILTNKKILLSHLFKAVSEALVDFGHTCLAGKLEHLTEAVKAKKADHRAIPAFQSLNELQTNR
jgi:hypothetical protein